MARQQIAAGNWKMNMDYDSAQALVQHLHNIDKPNDVKVILATPHPYLKSMADIVCHDECVNIAAQNIHHEEKGAYTGEVSALMVKSLGINYVVIGHSERRQYQQESNLLLKTKVDLALSNGLIPIFCCGESLVIRKSGEHISHVTNQLSESLFHLSTDDFNKIVIAYEPIWAIGTGETASPAQAQEMHAALRSFIAEKFGDEAADNCSLLYGGSVKPANAKELFGQADVDGGLVGGASLKADDFTQIIHSF